MPINGCAYTKTSVNIAGVFQQTAKAAAVTGITALKFRLGFCALRNTTRAQIQLRKIAFHATCHENSVGSVSIAMYSAERAIPPMVAVAKYDFSGPSRLGTFDKKYRSSIQLCSPANKKTEVIVS